MKLLLHHNVLTVLNRGQSSNVVKLFLSKISVCRDVNIFSLLKFLPGEEFHKAWFKRGKTYICMTYWRQFPVKFSVVTCSAWSSTHSGSSVKFFSNKDKSISYSTQFAQIYRHETTGLTKVGVSTTMSIQ